MTRPSRAAFYVRPVSHFPPAVITSTVRLRPTAEELARAIPPESRFINYDLASGEHGSGGARCKAESGSDVIDRMG